MDVILAQYEGQNQATFLQNVHSVQKDKCPKQITLCLSNLHIYADY